MEGYDRFLWHVEDAIKGGRLYQTIDAESKDREEAIKLFIGKVQEACKVASSEGYTGVKWEKEPRVYRITDPDGNQVYRVTVTVRFSGQGL